MFLGWIGDRFGRLSVFYPSLIVIISVGFGAAFVKNIFHVMICQFLIGIFISGTLLQAFIVISELVDHLALAGLLVYLSQPVGLCILTLKAYFIKDWKMLTMVCTAPYVIILLACGFVPESVKWLHLHREEIKMKKTIAYIAKWNKKTIPEHIKISELPKKLTRMTNPLDLFRSMTMASLTLTQGFLWMFVSICYYGVHLAANHLGGSVYRDFIILNAVEIPSAFLAIFCAGYVGKKRATLIPSCLGSLICIGIAFIPKTSSFELLRVILGVFGYFFTCIAFYAIYPWSVELFPLHVRNVAMGFLQLISHAGSGAVPWIVKELNKYGP